MDFQQALKQAQSVATQEALRVFHRTQGDPLQESMAYALAGGKALRGFLVLEGARLHKITAGMAAPAALAIECLHAYSLIHDDLPCMDNDDLRRGKPTVHRAWDEHTAVLAGDALQSLAFELLTELNVAAEVRVTLVRKLALAAGRNGMVGGQMLDIKAETSHDPVTLDQIITTQNGKTGALIRWSARAGAIMAQADTAPLDTYGDRLGLAFQIADDILDIEGDADMVGKAVRKDEDAGKATFVSLLGLDGAKRRAQDLVTDACDSLSVYGEEAERLRQAARFVITRQS